MLKEQGEQTYAALGYLRRQPSALFNQNRFIALSDVRLKEAEQAYATVTSAGGCGVVRLSGWAK